MFLWFGSDVLILHKNTTFGSVSKLNCNYLSSMQVEYEKDYGQAEVVINGTSKAKF